MTASGAPYSEQASALPLRTVLASIPTYPRPLIERLVTRMIEHLDARDGDPDSEANGEEAHGSPAEDDWHHASRPGGLSYVAPTNCDDAEDDDPRECNGDPERDEGTLTGYGIDQRIAAVGRGYAPWHIDKEEPVTS